MSSRLKPKLICVRSLVPKEKNSAVLAIWSASRQARGISIIVPYRQSTFTPVAFSTSACTRSTIALVTSSSLTSQVTGTMISGLALLAGLDQLGGRLEDRPDLHLGHFGIGDAQAHAAVAHHRVGLVQRLAALAARPRRVMPSALASSACFSAPCGTNSCSGGSSRRMVTGRPSIASSVALMSRLDEREQLVERPCCAPPPCC